jgi:hypothetical protein
MASAIMTGLLESIWGGHIVGLILEPLNKNDAIAATILS